MRITKSDLIKGLGYLGICALGGRALLFGDRREPAPSVAEQAGEEIELTEGEDFLKLKGGRIRNFRCLHCQN